MPMISPIWRKLSPAKMRIPREGVEIPVYRHGIFPVDLIHALHPFSHPFHHWFLSVDRSQARFCYRLPQKFFIGLDERISSSTASVGKQIFTANNTSVRSKPITPFKKWSPPGSIQVRYVITVPFRFRACQVGSQSKEKTSFQPRQKRGRRSNTKKYTPQALPAARILIAYCSAHFMPNACVFQAAFYQRSSR